jgi:peptidoglycan hydrolase-like protein with peptidoglycan-binding domain
MVFGNKGESVVELKGLLRSLEYPVTAFDLFDESTLNAVIDYQHHYSFNSTGFVDEDLLQDMRDRVRTKDASLYLRPSIRLGDAGAEVAHLQKSLKTLGFYPGEINGIFDSLTETSARHFQTSLGLEEESVVGPQTWNSLERHLALFVLPSKIRPILRQNDKGDFVDLLQEFLYESGFYAGEVNGIFDELTCNAVTRFQRAAGIVSDGSGVVGPETWAALDWRQIY